MFGNLPVFQPQTAGALGEFRNAQTQRANLQTNALQQASIQQNMDQRGQQMGQQQIEAFQQAVLAAGQHIERGGTLADLPQQYKQGLILNNEGPQSEADVMRIYQGIKPAPAPIGKLSEGQIYAGAPGADGTAPVIASNPRQAKTEGPKVVGKSLVAADGTVLYKGDSEMDATAAMRNFEYFMGIAEDDKETPERRQAALDQMKKSGLVVTTGPDGTTIAMGPGANGLTNATQGKMQMAQFSARKAKEAGERLLQKMEGAGATQFGLIGAGREAAAGMAGQLGMEGVSEALAPEEMLDMRYHARNTFGQVVAIVTGDTSGRYSDQDAKRAKEAVGVLDNTRDKRAAVRAVKTLLEFTEMIDRQATEFGGGEQKPESVDDQVNKLLELLNGN